MNSQKKYSKDTNYYNKKSQIKKLLKNFKYKISDFVCL